MSPPRILIHVQHLLGTGHLRRAALIAGGLAGDGMEVVLASGGMPVAGLDTGGARLVQLAPLRAADMTFRSLVDAAGRPLDAAGRALRRARLLALYDGLRPDALIVEMFPLGRRQLAFELDPLLARARADRRRPLVLCSVREALQEKPERRNLEMAARAIRDFDRILVHGDPALLPLRASFAAADRLEGMLEYTGYVAAPPMPPSAEAPAVLVSTGGGVAGGALLRAAAAARALSPLAHEPWLLLAGHDLPEEEFQRLAAAAGAAPGLEVQRARADFRALLAGCRISVSQAGYNTVCDILAADARAVLVPFAGAGETEQSLRADRLAKAGRAQVVGEGELGPGRLARAIGQALAGPAATPAVRLDGAAATVRAVRRMLERRKEAA